MRLNQIRDFVAVMQAGSLRAAARSLGVSQPAITKSLQQLEEELRVKLLQRTSHGVIATPAGKALLARARIVQAELRKAEDDLEVLRGGGAGSVAFGAAPPTCPLVAPEAMIALRRHHPGARVRITEGGNSTLLPLVRDGTLDFALGQKPVTRLDAALKFKPLFQMALAVGARAGHPLASSTSLRELAGVPWLVFNAPGSGGMLEQTFRAARLPAPRDLVHCESHATALAILGRTDALALVSRAMLTTRPAPAPLVRIDIAETVGAPVVGLYTRAGTPLTPAVATMVREITAVARKLARAR